jgi:hypothetical protein
MRNKKIDVNHISVNTIYTLTPTQSENMIKKSTLKKVSVNRAILCNAKKIACLDVIVSSLSLGALRGSNQCSRFKPVLDGYMVWSVRIVGSCFD